MKTGFIGLGIMGKPMAKNLVKAGYDVIVADKFAPGAVEELVARGAKAGSSNMDVGSQADIVITIPLTQTVLEMMKILHHDGNGSYDHSALLKYYQKLSGETLHH